jgi:acyl carrier protein
MGREISRADVSERFSGIVAKSLRIDPGVVTEATFLDDLGAESLDLIEITMETEEAFDIWISEKTILATAEEILGADVLAKDGVLTGSGKALLRDRLPDLDPALIEGEVSVKDITKQFLRVGAWVQMIYGLAIHTPDACPQCGSPLEKALAFRKHCKQCGADTQLLSGEEINKKWVEEFRDRYLSDRELTNIAAS